MSANLDVDTVTTPTCDSLTEQRYRDRLRQTTNIEATLRILAYTILTENPYIPNIEEFLGLPGSYVVNALNGLAPIVMCENNKSIRFAEGSFPDFLLDEARAGEFYIDWGVWHARFAHDYFERVKTGAYGTHELWLITDHLRNVNATQQLHEDILSFRYTSDQISYLSYACEELWDEVPNFLTAIKNLDFQDNNRAYNLQRRHMAGLLARDVKAFRGQLVRLAADHNIHPRGRRPPKPKAQSKGTPNFARRNRARRVLRNRTNIIG